ncbi:HNH endonuclease [Paraburkholderia youngii]|uniref:HNH endonuclease n=1 Tax=Paraburkholderia youngii TaxID=2782701 RepID=UPI003D1A3377
MTGLVAEASLPMKVADRLRRMHKQGGTVAFSDINDRSAVLAAMREFDETGRERFLKKYKFGKARSYFLVENGKRYDSKAIIGAAHFYQYPAEGPLTHEQFSGGELTVAKILEDMGFVVDRPRKPLERELSAVRGQVERTGGFSPHDLEDARHRTLVAIVQRQGQGRFRDDLLRAYGGKCAISMCNVPAVLEAAHIIPYKGRHTNHPSNGLLLRADLHTLFDLNLLAIAPDAKSVVIAPELRTTEYGLLHGKQLRMPAEVSDRPNEDALMARYIEADLKP